MSEYKSAFFVVPSRILELPDLQLSYLRIYETIFQFWNHGKQCYLKNEVIMERTGIKSDSTLREAFIYFEKHNELKRVYKGSRRYLVQPERKIEIEKEPVDNSKDDRSKNSQGVDLATGGRRLSDGQGVDLATHNNKKLNKEIKKESSLDLHGFPKDFIPDKEKPLPVDKFTKSTFTFTHEEMAEALDRDIDIQKVFNKFVDYKPVFKLKDWKDWFKREKNGKKAKNKHLDNHLYSHEQLKKLECRQKF